MANILKKKKLHYRREFIRFLAFSCLFSSNYLPSDWSIWKLPPNHQSSKFCWWWKWRIIPKKKLFKLRYSFLRYCAKVTTDIYHVNLCPVRCQKNGISHVFCWILENFVDICQENKPWISKTIINDWFSLSHNFWRLNFFAR